jgi:hypothetical protein
MSIGSKGVAYTIRCLPELEVFIFCKKLNQLVTALVRFERLCTLASHNLRIRSAHSGGRKRASSSANAVTRMKGLRDSCNVTVINLEFSPLHFVEVNRQLKPLYPRIEVSLAMQQSITLGFLILRTWPSSWWHLSSSMLVFLEGL